MDTCYKTRIFGNENKYIKEVLNSGYRASSVKNRRMALTIRIFGESVRFSDKRSIYMY